MKYRGQKHRHTFWDRLDTKEYDHEEDTREHLPSELSGQHEGKKQQDHGHGVGSLLSRELSQSEALDAEQEDQPRNARQHEHQPIGS